MYIIDYHDFIFFDYQVLERLILIGQLRLYFLIIIYDNAKL